MLQKFKAWIASKTCERNHYDNERPGAWVFVVDKPTEFHYTRSGEPETVVYAEPGDTIIANVGGETDPNRHVFYWTSMNKSE